MNIFKNLIITLVGIWASILVVSIFMHSAFDSTLFYTPPEVIIIYTFYEILLFIYVTNLINKLDKTHDSEIKIQYGVSKKHFTISNTILGIILNILFLGSFFILPDFFNDIIDKYLGMELAITLITSEIILIIGPVFSLIIIKLKDTISNYIQTRKKNNQ